MNSVVVCAEIRFNCSVSIEGGDYKAEPMTVFESGVTCRETARSKSKPRSSLGASRQISFL